MTNEDHQLSLIAEINHACDSLGLYRAELARILGLMCQDVSDSHVLEAILHDNKNAHHYAQRFIVFYNTLEKHYDGDSVTIINWFRKHNAQLETTPFLAMVDEHRIEDVISSIAL